ncbi:aminotransferase class I/II-fold pyridoxal phosphate-dependent enzyme [Streptomyces sp. SID8366]|uniref:pyridoxal phosphate-dependent aminotransferase n=1 Tax=unclassified Streptomyces TaxID=2593676 RepID=UPI000DBA7C79|nr:pyridoxal phosphate-dependent aminotransferase [Streptomyces sp. PsTaAH-130]MYU06450.1 aminotransferase class I/II-fold pyridoxal phosphate-dependent enzyme [Streptomyces sp. SID8366]MYU62525.1 aminotransferase class I/II-fold pyridoxal phosphate-dependent enzyme [Streptomyces sp. SID69]RAJ56252.1 N-succinyldiaminopimelate aminotransferase [Streptomyces sp. PsTaAH-130]
MPSLPRALGELGGSRGEYGDRVDALLRGSGDGESVPLHRGRTVFGACARPREWGEGEFGAGPDEEAPVGGVAELRAAFAREASGRRGGHVPAERVLVTGGATHALSLALRAVLRAGDEVLVLSPHWPQATGVVRAVGGVAREVPVFLGLGAGGFGFDLVGALEGAVTRRTRAVYFNSPNNPTGYRLDRRRLALLVELAERHDLWLIADNTYDGYDFTREGFSDIAGIGAAAERTFSVHGCGTTYAMPGNRVGYLVCPPGAAATAVSWARYTGGAVPTAAQFAAYEALRTPRAELDRRRDRAAAAWWLADSTLEVPHTEVSGGLYTFLDLRAWGDGERFVRRCAEHGVGLAPGRDFGAHCGGWARLCFTAAPPQRVAEAIQRINKVYGEGADEH